MSKPQKLTPQQVRKAIKDAYEIPNDLATAYTKASREAQRKVRQIQKQCPHKNRAVSKHEFVVKGDGRLEPIARCKDCGAEVSK